MLGRTSAIVRAQVGTARVQAARRTLVSWEVDETNRVATISIDNAAKLNALTVDVGEKFKSTIAEVTAASDRFGAVVLRGSGDRAFSAGGDLAFLRAREHDTPSRNAQIMRNFYSRFLSVRELPVPVVAAINGHAVGAGLCLALACDLRIASSKARMGVNFTKLGIHPGMGCTHSLPKAVGQQQAARLMLTGDLVTAEEALALGMVAEVAADSEACVERATALAAQIAANAPVAVRSTVRTLRMHADRGFDEALWREADTQSYCYASADLRRGVDAVADKTGVAFEQFEGYAEEDAADK